MSVRIRAALLLCAFSLTAFASTSAGARERSTRMTELNELERAVLIEINAVRRRHGLAALRADARLGAAAAAHSTSMATRGFFAHESPDGSSFSKRVARYYPRGRGSWSAGENLLWSSPSVEAAGSVRLWMNSPPHRRNLLTSRWREIGLSAVHVAAGPGVFGGAPVTILTADFGRRH